MFINKIKPVVRKVPILSDFIGFYWDFKRAQTAVRGVYDSREAALKAIPNHFPTGYDQENLIMNSQDVAELTAARKLGELDHRDAQVLKILASILEPGSSVFNIGGNIGIEYYPYKEMIPEIKNVNWTVCEIDSVVERGRTLAAERGEKRLTFTTNVQDGDGSDIVLCIGAAQYLSRPLVSIVAAFDNLPKHVIISNSPALEDKEYYTIQNIGYAFVPYHVLGITRLKDEFNRLGYDLAESWAFPRFFAVPFFKDHNVSQYYGFHFRRRPSDSESH